MMASSISPLSYLDTSAYQSLPPTSSTASAAELHAMQRQGNFQAFLSDSMAAALLQPADGASSGTAADTLIDNMLQQVLGAYQTHGTSKRPCGAGVHARSGSPDPPFFQAATGRRGRRPRSRGTAPRLMRHHRLKPVPPSTSRAAATTVAGRNPNFFCTSFNGADAPNVCMPMVRPRGPT